MIIVPFQPAHGAEIVLQDSQAGEWHDRAAAAARFAGAGNAFTLLGADGAVLFCGGACEVNDRWAQLWGVFALGKRQAMHKLLRATRAFIAALPYARVDAHVLDRPEARRWAELIGLTFETALADAAPDGGDYLIYRRAS